MKPEVFGISRFDEKAVVVVLLFFGIAEALLGAYKKGNRNRNDYATEIFGFTNLTIFIQPGVLLLVAF